MKNYKFQVIKLIKEKYPSFEEKSITIPPNENMGDFSIPAFIFAKEFQMNPNDAAKKLKDTINVDSIGTSSVVGPYLNIKIDRNKFVKDVLKSIDTEKENFAKGDKKEIKKNNKKNIVIDYSQPNVAKNMGIHNLRSTIIGNALYNTYKHLGYNVVGVNHLGDWGTQFGKLIWALEKWSSFEELEEKGILFLNDMYVKYHDVVEKEPKEISEKMEEEARLWFKRIEDDDPIAKKWWEIFVKVSMIEYNKIYERLNIKFDYVTGESFYIQFLDETLKKLKRKKLTTISDGALVVSFHEKENMPPCLLRKSDGATLYGTRDVAAIFYRLKTFKPTKILYVVDVAQELHFKQVFKVMELFDSTIREKLEHVMFGRLSFPDGSMSTRKGNIIPVTDVLNKSKEKVLEIINEKNPELINKDEVSEIVGTGAIIFGDLIHDRLHNIIFEWEKVLDFQGETAPYIQYTHARIKSILRKENSQKFNPKYLTDELEFALVKKMYNLNEVLQNVVKQNKPSILAKYIVELCQLFNSYYVKVSILKEKKKLVKNSRLFLISQVAQTIKISTTILGIKVPEEM
jgi:arginyl-tRNA synthetase